MSATFARALAALACGLIFGLGLSMSGMLDPARVRGFLDIAGAWDPSLALVMGGAVTVTFCGLIIVRRMRRPLLGETFRLTTNRRIDARLLGGSALFGIGWGLAGFCPGPAIAALSTGLVPVLAFVAAMVAGMVLHDRLLAPRDGANVPLQTDCG
jgi:uncharacterized membrane protein YedE/YeeE